MGAASAGAFESMARPLLELVERVTGLETSFLTEIDWESQTQEVVLARNSGELEVAEGSVVPWAESMCRWSFLAGKELSTDVARDYPGSLGSEQLGMQTFFAIPIVDGDLAVGTVCGASRRTVDLDEETVEILRLVAQALTNQFRIEVESNRQRRRADEAEALAMTDPLTRLPNRRAFTTRFEAELARAGRQGTPLALLLIDVDDFKSVNDTRGHAAGDSVLVALAEVLRRVARTEDLAARLGGDEFAVVLAGASADDAAAVGDRIAAEFRSAVAAIGSPCTASVGVASSEAVALRDLLDEADRLLYVRKEEKDGIGRP